MISQIRIIHFQIDPNISLSVPRKVRLSIFSRSGTGTTRNR